MIGHQPERPTTRDQHQQRSGWLLGLACRATPTRRRVSVRGALGSVRAIMLKFRPGFGHKVTRHIADTGEGFAISHHSGFDDSLGHRPQGPADHWQHRRRQQHGTGNGDACYDIAFENILNQGHAAYPPWIGVRMLKAANDKAPPKSLGPHHSCE
jgi:hypothetical protein